MPPPRPPSAEPQRIAKLLARAGIASRREIERMIEERRIAINGIPIDKPATLLTSLHGVTVDGRPVKAAAPARLFRYHKPTGLLTAERDPQGRLTIYDRLPKDLPRVIPVGRLDLNTEGLLLLTTDGELKRQLELPSTGVERAYRARVFGEISQDRLEALIEGIEIEGVRYGSIDANLERRTGRNAWVEMKLTEGKNREVRRVLEHLGLRVSRLIRIAYGPFQLGDLAAGAVDEVRQHDLVAFRKWLADPSAAHMEPIAGSRSQREDRGRTGRDSDRRGDPRKAAAAPKRPPRAKPGPGRPGRAQPGAEKAAGGQRAERSQRWRDSKPGAAIASGNESGADRQSSRRGGAAGPSGAKPGPARAGRIRPGADKGPGGTAAERPKRWRDAKTGSAARAPGNESGADRSDSRREGASSAQRPPAAKRGEGWARPRRPQEPRKGRAGPGKRPPGGRPRGPARP